MSGQEETATGGLRPPTHDILGETEFRARRYRDAEVMVPLEKHPAKNRLSIGVVTVAWKCTRWENLFWDWWDPDTGESIDQGPVQFRTHSVSLFTGAEPIGIAQFNTYRFDEGMFTETFVLAADGVSQELYDFSEGLARTLKSFDTDDEDWIDSGTCIVEFKRLVMRAGHAGKLHWVAPVQEFIRKQYRTTPRDDYRALVLCPFPLEFEGARSIRLGDEALDRRRRAMVRLYERVLGVTLVVPATDERLWMARSLASD